MSHHIQRRVGAPYLGQCWPHRDERCHAAQWHSQWLCCDAFVNVRAKVPGDCIILRCWWC